ncbi:MAG: acylphosphatase [Rhodospirillales bacterium]|nr:acylphosphatase [Rhodospirillales bacterium]
MPRDTLRKSVSVRIEGRVQGVWYRGWTVDQATSLGLSGWVRNWSDGSVEAVFSGEAAKVDQMLQRCWDGPPMAQVSAVSYQSCEPPEPGFRQRYSLP